MQRSEETERQHKTEVLRLQLIAAETVEAEKQRKEALEKGELMEGRFQMKQAQQRSEEHSGNEGGRRQDYQVIMIFLRIQLSLYERSYIQGTSQLRIGKVLALFRNVKRIEKIILFDNFNSFGNINFQ